LRELQHLGDDKQCRLCTLNQLGLPKDSIEALADHPGNRFDIAKILDIFLKNQLWDASLE
jgi:hypothetical protein